MSVSITVPYHIDISNEQTCVYFWRIAFVWRCMQKSKIIAPSFLFFFFLFFRSDSATFSRALRNSWRNRLGSSSRAIQALRYLINLHDCINETTIRRLSSCLAFAVYSSDYGLMTLIVVTDPLTSFRLQCTIFWRLSKKNTN